MSIHWVSSLSVAPNFNLHDALTSLLAPYFTSASRVRKVIVCLQSCPLPFASRTACPLSLVDYAVPPYSSSVPWDGTTYKGCCDWLQPPFPNSVHCFFLWSPISSRRTSLTFPQAQPSKCSLCLCKCSFSCPFFLTSLSQILPILQILAHVLLPPSLSSSMP